MPFPLIPVIAAGAGLAGQIFNTASNSANNNRQINWAREQMNTQRSWALEDWDKQNKYNSPAEQMKRFSEAGLNPHLIYGQMSNAAPVRSTSVDTPRTNPSNIDTAAITKPLMEIFEVMKTQQQTDNLKAQKDLIEADIRLKNFNLSSGSQMLPEQLTAVRLSNANKLKDLDKKDVEMYTMLNRNDRETLASTRDLVTAVEKILSMRAEREKTWVGKQYLQQMISNLKKDGQLKQLDINLKSKGVQPGDPMWMRAGAQILSGVTPEKVKETLQGAAKDLKDYTKEFFNW